MAASFPERTRMIEFVFKRVSLLWVEDVAEQEGNSVRPIRRLQQKVHIECDGDLASDVESGK